MIRLNHAYSSLLKVVRHNESTNEKQEKDNAYSIYREGILKYQNIPPSKWKTYSIDGLFNADAIKTSPETSAIIKSLLAEMAEA